MFNDVLSLACMSGRRDEKFLLSMMVFACRPGKDGARDRDIPMRHDLGKLSNEPITFEVSLDVLIPKSVQAVHGRDHFLDDHE